MGQKVGSVLVERTMFLSGRIGNGHEMFAKACAQLLAAHGVESRTLDAIDLMGGRAGAAGEWVFRRILGVPAVYDAFHFTQLRAGGQLAHFAERTALRFLYSRLAEAIRAFSPELIVSLYPTGAAGAARYRSEHSDIVAVVFVTDALAHRGWVHPETDLFLVVSPAAAATVRQYRPSARIEVVTPPVRTAFHWPPSRAEARRWCGVPDDARCALLISGGWGIGPLDRAARQLSDDGVWVLAVAGSNEALLRRMQAEAANRPRIVPFGWTDRVADLMAACDVVVTSPGYTTCQEARTVGRRLVLLDVVPGHGRENLAHQLELGDAAMASADPALIADVVAAVLDEGRADPVPVGSAEECEREWIGALASIGVELP